MAIENSQNTVCAANNGRGGTHSSGGGSGTGIFHKQMSFKTSLSSNQLYKSDEIEVLESGNVDDATTGFRKNTAVGWICCAPCIWMRTSVTVHKFAITTATLLVTTLLVASPILFLISTAPSQLPRDCYNDQNDCVITTPPPPECTEHICLLAASGIQAKVNWSIDPCQDFKKFSCSEEFNTTKVASLHTVRNAQEWVDLQVQLLLQHNTTEGPFRKLGRLYGSCLKQTTNSSTIKLVLEELGGYLPIGAVGPSTIAPLITKIFKLGPTPLVDIYYDLSYGRHPQVLLIINSPTIFAPILESKIRWIAPKAPPYRSKEGLPKLLGSLFDNFIPSGLSYEQKTSEYESVVGFITELNKIRVQHSRRGFWYSSVLYNISSLQEFYPILDWSTMVPINWNGPIVVRSSEYLNSLRELLMKYPTRVAHNSILLLFALGILPEEQSDPVTCTRATMWALPDVTSALYITQHTSDDLNDVIIRTETIFKSLKAYLKRAPSLKGAALVKLSALKISPKIWGGFTNMSEIIKNLDSIEITSDNWFENVLNIYKRDSKIPEILQIDTGPHDAWAYPIVSKIFYDTLSHSIVIPLSVVLIPYFDKRLPPYLQYASVGISIAKEILRSITKSFEDKVMNCVPDTVNIFSNYSRMDVLIHSGGIQISYHSLLSLSGPNRGMARLPGLNLTPTQIFFLLTAQQLCGDSSYIGVNTESLDFSNILGWLVSQGGSANDVYKCSPGSMIYAQKTCNVL